MLDQNEEWAAYLLVTTDSETLEQRLEALYPEYYRCLPGTSVYFLVAEDNGSLVAKTLGIEDGPLNGVLMFDVGGCFNTLQPEVRGWIVSKRKEIRKHNKAVYL